MGKKIFLVFLLSITFSKAQDCTTEVKDIYKNIVKSIGNSFPPPPKLIISEKKRAVAYLNKEGITIETAVIDLFCGKKNFEDKIAYVISHELAHHYLNHTWMRNTSLGYVSSIGEFVDNQSSSYDQRKLAETSADLFGGFFGQIAGYNVLSYAKQGLEEIYNHYKLPKEIKGYPSFEDRLNIINSKIEDANKLTTLFNVGNILMMLGKYDEAKLCFEDILKENFTSREIYNNLGLVFLLKAISISDPKISKFIYPLSIDFQTRADISATRSGDFLNDADKLFSYAKEQFNQSIRLDEDYYFAKKNILILEFIQALKDDKENDFLKTENFELLDQATQVDLEVISRLNRNKKRKKVLKIAKRGSYVSKQNINYDDDEINEYSPEPKQIFDIDISKYILSGLPKPNKKIKTKYSDLKLTIKDFDKYVLTSIRLNRKNIFYILKSKKDYNFKGQIKYKNNFYLVLE